ncbi:hypothetical protein ACLKMH_03970 [Psychromonas sp. KJ10-10]|uniref:hypothetical protein n=1 Tax=Psychromonas sp. KJ10-10 TaxID=3391823 RepID=UPI0039B40BC0
MKMKNTILSGAIALAILTSSSAFSADLKYQPGKDNNFNWASFEKFKNEVDLKGQVLTIKGPWLGADKKLIESVIAYFEAKQPVPL